MGLFVQEDQEDPRKERKNFIAKGVAVTRGLYVVYRDQSLSNVTFPQVCVFVYSCMHTQAAAQMWSSGDNLVGAGSLFFPG